MSSQELPQTIQPADIAEQALPQEERNSQLEPSSTEPGGQETARPKASKSEVPSSDAALPSSPSPTKSEHVRTEPEINALKRKSPTRDDNQEIVPAKTKEDDTQDTKPASKTTSHLTSSSTTDPRIVALQSKLSTLQSTLNTLQSQHASLVSTLPLPSGLAPPADQTPQQALQNANGVIKEHIALLHSYNEIKDIGMGLMGLVADKRGLRVKVVMEEFGMGEGD